MGANSSASTKAPSPTPTPIEAGKLRPARDFSAFAGGFLVGSEFMADADPLLKAWGGCFNYISINSFSLDSSKASMVSTCFLVRASISFSARVTSSSPASPSFFNLAS